MQKLHSKALTLLLAIIFIINLIPNSLVLANSNENEEKEIIRVGYMENYGVLKSPMVQGYEGYGYEYLRKMEEYIDYEFEFVLCDWLEIIDMLRSGEVDVITPFRLNEERAEEFYFTEHNFAREIMLIISDDIMSFDETSYELLNDATIGVREGSAAYPYLLDFVEKYDLSPKIHNVETSDFLAELKQGTCEYFLTGSLQMETDLNIAVSLGSSQTYFMGNSKEIIDKLDYAMNQIDDRQFLYQEELQTKYFHHNIGANKYISNNELELMQSQSSYDVGVINIYPTFGYTNQTEINNISVDVLNFIAEKLELDLNLVEISVTTSKEELDKLDFYIYYSGYVTDWYDNKSIPYMTDNLLLIENKNLNLASNVGVLDYYNLDYDFVQTLSHRENVEYYSSIRSLLDDFNNQNISSIVVANSIYELMYELIKPTSHQTTNLYYPILPTIVYTDHFPIEKIEVIDKAISYITPETINEMLLYNMSLISAVERKLMYTRYFYTILFTIILVVMIVQTLKYTKQKEVDRVASYDRLTNLYTQPKFIKETKKLLNKNPNTKFTMFTFDIDNFKYLNELYGFETGDKILNLIGEFLKENLNAGYPVARFSSDHFILITKTNENLRHGKIDEYLNDVLSKRIYNLTEEKCDVNYSVGLYFIDDLSIDVEQMIDYCNLARSYSKQELGSVLTVYSELMNEKENVKNDIIHRMSNALINNEFVLYYQPKFHIVTQKVVGAEALVRWFADGKMMPPNDFIPLFEKNGFIEKLDYYVLETVCKFINSNKSINMPVISVNLSSITIMKNDVIERIFDILDTHALEPKQIELEVTESAFVDQFELALQRIDDLRSRGFTISMDDFGTGVSSLGRLKNMKLDVLKIDREFIIETLANEKSDIILQSIISMANKLELETIAEGIETEEQLNFLKDNGCSIGQGYYFAKPLPPDEFLKLLIV